MLPRNICFLGSSATAAGHWMWTKYLSKKHVSVYDFTSCDQVRYTKDGAFVRFDEWYEENWRQNYTYYQVPNVIHLAMVPHLPNSLLRRHRKYFN